MNIVDRLRRGMHGVGIEPNNPPTVSCPRLQTQLRLHVGMSFEEILEELPELTAAEKERLRQLLDYQLLLDGSRGASD